jgi:hypothetical protein
MEWKLKMVNKEKIIFKNVDSQALVAHACNPSSQEAEIRRIVVQSQPR